ncbi:MAG: hypothetical protein WD008_00465 [Balneolaceae bacterium]
MISAMFQGVNPVLPIIVIVITTVLALFISWWTYSNMESLIIWKKWALITLRASSLLILIFLLINPYTIRETISDRKPVVSIYFDNSQSVLMERGTYDGEESYSELRQNLTDSFSDSVDLQINRFDDHVASNDTIDGTGVNTNLQAVIEHILENEGTVNAAVIVSDGIITRGRNPVFSAQSLATPVFTIPVGDTSRVKDIVLSDVEYNNTVFTNTQQNFSVSLQQEGYSDEDATVQFFRDGDLIESESINFNADVSSHSIDFSQQFTEPGFYDFSVRIPPKNDEFTDQNNQTTFTVEVLDNKTTILSLAFEVHPDIKSIRNLIATDEQNELIQASYFRPGTPVGADPLTLNVAPELIVLHGLPEAGSEITEWISNQTVPVLYLPLPGTFFRPVPDGLENKIVLIPNQRNNFIDVRVQRPADNRDSNPILEFTLPDFDRLPPLKTARVEYTISPLAQTLLNARYQRVATNIPLLVTEDASAIRYAAVNAFNWYLYEQSFDDQADEYFSEFFTNLISWTATPPDQKSLDLQTPKSTYTETEAIEVQAVLTNERGDLETDGTIELRVTGSGTDEQKLYRMNHIADGTYRASIGSYPEGRYTIAGTATKENRELGSSELRVNVSPSSNEYKTTQRNDELLNQLATVSNGLFTRPGEFHRIEEVMREKNLMQQTSDVTTTYLYIRQSFWWFVLVLLLLAGEWILRRTVSLP